MPKVQGLPTSPPIDPPAELSDELAGLLGPRVARLGYLGAFFAVSARQPDALAGFIRFTESLKCALPHDLVEVVALRTASALGNAYEQAQHEALARVDGRSPAWIAALTDKGAPDDVLDSDHRLVRDLTDAVLARAGRTADTLVLAVDRFGADRAVAVVLLISRFVAHAHAAEAFGLIDPLSSEASHAEQSAQDKEN